MKNRRHLLLFTIALLFCATGCKKDVPAALSTPAAIPSKSPAKAQAALQQQIASTMEVAGKPGPDLETATPLRTIEVKPPVSFGSDQFPQQGVFEFRVAGDAGQVLHVKLNHGWYQYVLVQQLGDSKRLMIPGGDELGNRLYVLPQTGVYRVVAQRIASKETPATDSAIQFSLLNIGDPLVDPGLRPEQLSGDFAELAPQGKWGLVPYSNFDGVDDHWPSHLAFQDGQFEFRIMPTVEYKRIVSAQAMDNLRSALRADAGGGDPRKFPYATYGDAALMIATRPKLIQGEGWQGFRWIGIYAQDSGCFFTDFSYIFEGVTKDGKFFMRLQTGIANSQAAKHLTQRCTDESKAQTFDEFFDKQMPALFDKELSSADPGSFQPNLDRLDGVVQSFKIK